MKEKPLIHLTKSDLLEHPIWEHWLVDNIEFVKPSDLTELNDSVKTGYIVQTDFSLNNDTNLTGFCSPQDPSGLDYIQPVVFSDNGQIRLWRDCGWTQEAKEKEIQKLGLDWKDVFPIKYRTLVKINGDFYHSTLVDFNEERRTMHNRVARNSEDI